MRFLFIVYAMISSLQVVGQTITIKSKVVDADGNGIPYATIAVEGHGQIGTFANDQGEFELRVPGYVNEGKLVVSSLGYQKRVIAINEANVQIHLEKGAILLGEIIVSPVSELQRLGKAVLKAMSKNYPNKIHYQTAFYRKISTDSSQYTGFVESILYIKDPGYQRNSSEVRIEALQARAGDNTIPTDSTLMKTLNKMSLNYDAEALGSLQRVYNYNLVRLFKEPHTYFYNGKQHLFTDMKGPATKTFELEDITVEGRDTIFHMVIRSLMAGGKMQAEETHLAINKKDKAIVEYSRLVFTNLYMEVKFKKHSNGKYYLKSIYSVTPNFSPKDRNTAYYKIETLEVDDLEFKSSKDRRKGIVLGRDADYDPKKVPYDSAFWNSYKNKRPINPDVLKSLERDRPLEKQFNQPV